MATSGALYELGGDVAAREECLHECQVLQLLSQAQLVVNGWVGKSTLERVKVGRVGYLPGGHSSSAGVT